MTARTAQFARVLEATERELREKRQRRAERTMEANNLLVGQFCADLLSDYRRIG